MEKLARGLLGLLTLLVGLASAEARNPPQYVFLVDTSASMIGQEDGSTVIFPQVQRELMRFTERVVDEAEIRIVPFSQEPQGVARFVLPREREEMLRYIRSLRAEGSSSFIYRSLNKVYDELCSEPRAFYLFTDGLDNSAEPARMPEQKSLCPLTLVTLGTLPQDFAGSWKGLRQSSLTNRPTSQSPQTTPTPPDPLADRQEKTATETPGVPVAPADSTSKAGIVQAGVQKEYGEEPGPQPAPAPKPTNPGARPTSPQPRATPPSPRSPQITPSAPQSQPRPRPPATAPSIKPQATPSATPPPAPTPVPRQPAEPAKPQSSAPPTTVAPPATLVPPPKPTPPPFAKPQPPKPAQYLLETVGSPSLVDGAVVVVYRLEGSAEATLPLLLSLKEVPPTLRVSYNDNPTAISLRPGQQFELRVSNQSPQEAVVETAFRVVSAPGALVELPPVLQLKVPPIVVSRDWPGWLWALVGLLGAMLLGLSQILVRMRRTAPVALRAEPMGTGLSMSYGPSEGVEVRVLYPSPTTSLISLDFFGAAPEQRRKYIPALMSEYDLGEIIGDAGLERLRVRPGLGGLEVIHIPGHLSLSIEAKDPLTPGQTVELGRTIYISDISNGAGIGILSVQKM